MLASEVGLTVKDLKQLGLFGALPDAVLSELMSRLTVAEPNAGEMVFREGDPARDFFVVLLGEVEVLKQSRRGQDTRVALLGAGDWFGEMSILDIQPRSASVRALAPSRLLKLTVQDLDALYRNDVKAYALIVLNIARELSRRLRVTDAILADFMSNVLDSYVAQRGTTQAQLAPAELAQAELAQAETTLSP